MEKLILTPGLIRFSEINGLSPKFKLPTQYGSQIDPEDYSNWAKDAYTKLTSSPDTRLFVRNSIFAKSDLLKLMNDTNCDSLTFGHVYYTDNSGVQDFSGIVAMGTLNDQIITIRSRVTDPNPKYSFYAGVEADETKFQNRSSFEIRNSKIIVPTLKDIYWRPVPNGYSGNNFIKWIYQIYEEKSKPTVKNYINLSKSGGKFEGRIEVSFKKNILISTYCDLFSDPNFTKIGLFPAILNLDNRSSTPINDDVDFLTYILVPLTDNWELSDFNSGKVGGVQIFGKLSSGFIYPPRWNPLAPSAQIENTLPF